MNKLLRSLSCGLMLGSSLIASNKAAAQMVGADVFLKGDYVEIGVGTGGWYGSGAPGPAGFHGRTGGGTTVGFVSDPDKDGWAVGVPNYCGDYFVPGYPQEGWDFQVGSAWTKAWLGTGFVGGMTGVNTGYTSTGSEMRGIWEGNFAGIAIRQTTILRKEKLYFLIKVTLKNTTSADITDIFYDRTLDPDNVSTMGPTGSVPGIVTSSSSSTLNTIEFKLPNPKSRSLVSAIGQLTVVKPSSPDTVDYPVYLGIGSKDCRARPYILSSGLTPGTLDSPKRLYYGQSPAGTTHLFDSGQSNFTDVATGLIFHIDRIKPGDSTSFFMAYVLSTADLDSAFADMAPVWQFEGRQYESGDTIKLCRNKTAPDEKKALNIGGGDEYSWTWESRPGLKNLTGTINEINLTNTPTTYVVRPSETFGCMDSMVITIMPYINPDLPAVVSPVTYCRYSAADPLKATAMPGAALRFYTTASGGTPVPTFTPKTLVDGTFTYYVSQINGICESDRVPITVIVNPIPDLDSFTLSHPTFCGAKDGWIRFKANLKNEDYTVYFDRDGNPQTPVSITSDANGFLDVTGLVRGSYTAFYIKNKFGCVSNIYFGPVVLEGPFAPAPTVSNNGPICAGEMAQLMTALKDSTTYMWRGPGGYTSTEANPSFISSAESGGVYTLVATKKSCVSNPAKTTLVIFPFPKNPNLPDMALCVNDQLLAEVPNEINTDYVWTGPAGFSSSTATLLRKNIQLDHAGQYILNASNERGCKMSDTIEVVIDPRVTLVHSADTSICFGDKISLFANTNTSAVLWSPATGVNDVTSKNPVVGPSVTTIYTVLAKSDHSACPDTSGTVKVSVIPTPMVKGYDTLVRMNIPYTILPTFGQEVVKWKWTPSDSLSCADCPNPTFNSNKQMTYVVYGTDINGCTGSDKVTITVFCDGANVTMPNAFTPNGDGDNDIFYVRGTGFTVKSFAVYNRLGQEVFRKENFAPNDPQYGWNGSFGGQEISDAAGFVYMMEVVCFDSKNEPMVIKGTVLMIK